VTAKIELNLKNCFNYENLRILFPFKAFTFKFKPVKDFCQTKKYWHLKHSATRIQQKINHEISMGQPILKEHL